MFGSHGLETSGAKKKGDASRGAPACSCSRAGSTCGQCSQSNTSVQALRLLAASSPKCSGSASIRRWSRGWSELELRNSGLIALVHGSEQSKAVHLNLRRVNCATPTG